MPIEDDVWGAPVPEGDDGKAAPAPQKPAAGGSGANRNLLIGGGLVAVIVIVVVVVIAAGGGGGGGGGGLTLAKWVKKADAVCAADYPVSDQEREDGDFDDFTTEVAKTVNQLEAIPLPTTHRSQIKSIEADDREEVKLLEEAVQTGDATTQASVLEQLTPINNEMDDEMGTLGSTVCSS